MNLLLLVRRQFGVEEIGILVLDQLRQDTTRFGSVSS
jgi:hypothetical protein